MVADQVLPLLSHSTAASGAELVSALVLVSVAELLEPEPPDDPVLALVVEDEEPLAPVVDVCALLVAPVAAVLVPGEVVLELGAALLVVVVVGALPVLLVVPAVDVLVELPDGATGEGFSVVLSPQPVATRLAATAAMRVEPLTTKGKARKRMGVT